MVLDANILIRAVLGSRVLTILHNFAGQVQFLSPFAEAREHLPAILARRNIDVSLALATLDLLADIVQIVGGEAYTSFERAARARTDRRDPEDWPVLATALAMNSPIWTEDTDFFGCGVATWTTDRIELYLNQQTQAKESDE